MGSYATLARQSAILAALVIIAVIIAPPEAKPWVAGVGAVALIFFVSVSFVRHRQVLRLAQEVDEVLHNGRRLDFSNCREGDVAALANELDKMVARLVHTSEQLATERNALADSLADISHQIRTPLTAVSLMLPQVERAEDAAERKRLARELELMIERVSWLVTALMKIAKVDAGALQTARQPVNAAAMVRHAFSPLEMAYDLHDISIAWDLDEQATFLGDENWTSEAVENALKNCMEHTPAGGTVTVTVSEDALATTIAISDTGPGIAEQDLPHVFERFYRGEHVRGAVGSGDVVGNSAGEDEGVVEDEGINAHGNSCEYDDVCEHELIVENEHVAADESLNAPDAQQGFGIGLALTQALVSAQGGTIRAANNPQGGAIFTIAFPKFVI